MAPKLRWKFPNSDLDLEESGISQACLQESVSVPSPKVEWTFKVSKNDDVKKITFSDWDDVSGCFSLAVMNIENSSFGEYTVEISANFK